MAMAMTMGLSLKMPVPTRSIGTGHCSFLRGSTRFFTPNSTTANIGWSSNPSHLAVRAMKKLQGKVVCSTNDKTVKVEVVRLAIHPKYKKRVRKRKKYQAHDPDNKFKVGDLVELEKCRPISKTKAFLALPVPPRANTPPTTRPPSEEYFLRLESSATRS